MLRLPDAKSREEISQRLEEQGITYERVEDANAIKIFVSPQAAQKLAENAEKFKKITQSSMPHYRRFQK